MSSKIANLEPTFPYSHCGPIQLLDTFKCTTQFMGYADIFHAAQVCKLWNDFSKDPFIWQQFFKEEGIPFVESVGGQSRDYKHDFRVLYLMTISLKMSERLFGKVDRKEMPSIHWTWFAECLKKDSCGPGEVRNNYKFVVFPDAFEGTACEEFPFDLNENSDLIAPESAEWRGKTLQIPNTIRNLKILCEHPLAGKKNMPVFEYFDDNVLKQCNTRPNKISVFFMRTCIADETRTMSYSEQKLFVESRGFEVTPLGVRVFFDAVCILTSGTCPDAKVPRWSYARTSDTVRVGNDVYQATIGGFAPGSGARVDDHYYGDVHIGVSPGGSAEVPRPLAHGALELDKGH